MHATRPSFAGRLVALPGWIAVLLATLSLWGERRRQRLALARLDPRLLRDVGVTHTAAARESRKPFWK